jgi:hypothetical protein
MGLGVNGSDTEPRDPEGRDNQSNILNQSGAYGRPHWRIQMEILFFGAIVATMIAFTLIAIIHDSKENDK